MSLAMEWAARNLAGSLTPKPRRLRHRAKIHLHAFIRPDGHWPYPYTIEQAFEVFRWLVGTGDAERCPTDYPGHEWGPRETLSMGSGVCYSDVDPIRSLKDLRERFLWALFAWRGGEATARWRAVNNITVDAVVDLEFPHHKPFAGGAGFRCEREIEDALRAMFDVRGKRLVASPNSIHPRALIVECVTVAVRPDGYDFTLRYGYDGSGWHLALAHTERKEPFLATFDRARAFLDILTGRDGANRTAGALVDALNGARPQTHRWERDEEWGVHRGRAVYKPRWGGS